MFKIVIFLELITILNIFKILYKIIQKMYKIIQKLYKIIQKMYKSDLDSSFFIIIFAFQFLM